MSSTSASPPTRRVVEIVALLSAANRPITVAGIAEGLGIARATATAILDELSTAGWVVREPNRGYTLGPGLAGLRGTSLPHGIGDLLAALADRTACGATLSRIEPEHLTVIDRRHGTDRVIAGLPIGHRVPLQFPAGASVMPWRAAHEQNAWVRTADHDQRRTAGTLLALVKDRGVAVFRPRADDAGMVELLAEVLDAVGSQLMQPALRARVLRQLASLTARPFTAAELDGKDDLPLSYLAAPVFDASGSPNYEVQLGPLRAETTKPERDEYISALLDTAREATAVLAAYRVNTTD